VGCAIGGGVSLRKSDHVSKVLITDGHYKQSLALARLFHDLGFEVHTAGERLSQNRFSKYWKYFSFHQLGVGEQRNSDPILNLLSRFNYDLVVPVGANSVARASDNFDKYSSKSRIYIPDQKKISVAFDKFASTNIALQLGLKAPKTVTAEDWLSLPITSGKSFIIKNKREIGERIQTQYFSDNDEITKFILSFDSTHQENLIVQERIHGSGEAFFAFYKDGVLLDSYTHKRVREIPSSGGSSTCAITTDADDVHQAGKKILDHLCWHGPAMVEFKREFGTDQLYLMEINPKFWGSLHLGISAGFNPAKLYFDLIHGSELSVYTRKIHKIIKFQWPWHGDISQVSGPQDFLAVFTDLLNPRVRKNLNLLDPLPIFLAPGLAAIRFILKSKVIQHFRVFFARIRVSSFRVASQRSLEEFFGIPLTNKMGRQSHVVLGPQISWIGKLKLRLQGVNSSISLQSEFDDALNGLTFANFLHLPCDEYSILSDSQLIEGVTTLHKWILNNSKIYVHCREGVSRAAYLGIAFEVSNGRSIEEAINILKLQRSFINPLPCQIDSIERNVVRLRKIGLENH
jgi:predicted ATP-grasp superfamily ATP-dependent carboligase